MDKMIINALNQEGFDVAATAYEKAIKVIDKVVQEEGILGFKKRPQSTQVKLNAANKIINKTWSIIEKNKIKLK